MRIPAKATLKASVSLGNFGADIVKLADINNDGNYELLLLQTAGQLRSRLYVSRNDVDDVDRSLYCLTATDLDGNILWQDGTPYDREIPYTCHGGEQMLLVEDLDADGRMEVAVIRGRELAILDGATGECKRSVMLPADNMVSLFSAQLGAADEGRQLICKVNDSSCPPWKYANPTMIFNPDLSVRHDQFAVRGAGHNIVALDVNNDGRDELLIGYSLLDSEMNEVWRLDLGPGFDYEDDHADEISVSDINGDGSPEIRYAGSEDFFVVSLDGKILWKATSGHSQTSIQGKWGPSGELRVIMNEKNKGVWGMDPAGNILWNRTDINGYTTHDVRWHRSGTRTD